MANAIEYQIEGERARGHIGYPEDMMSEQMDAWVWLAYKNGFSYPSTNMRWRKRAVVTADSRCRKTHLSDKICQSP
jgi:hypothetical protein